MAMEAQKKRFSDQQRIERELFPECIQAPIKYYNKRKSLNISMNKRKGKERMSFPREKFTTDSSKQYVEQWLMQQEKEGHFEKRQPFKTLNVNLTRLNQESNTLSKHSHQKSIENSEQKKENIKKLSRKRRCNITSSNGDTNPNIGISVTSIEKQPSTFTKLSHKKSDSNKKITDSEFYDLLGWNPKSHKWESKNYAVDPNDVQNNDMEIETLVIEDTQSDAFDKDKLALLAVQEASNIQHSTPNFSEAKLHCSEIIRLTDIEKTSSSKQSPDRGTTEQKQNIPFIKKDTILEKSKLCKDNNGDSKNKTNDQEGVTITIETKDFITTFKLSESVKNEKPINKQSVSVQTDICETDYLNMVSKVTDIKTNIETQTPNLQKTSSILPDQMKENIECLLDQDSTVGGVNSDIKNKVSVNKHTKNKLTIIPESESDVEDEHKSPTINAEVTFGVLTELRKGIFNTNARTRNRHPTPTSTDSSDKENRDPNRMRLRKSSKKKCKKK